MILALIALAIGIASLGGAAYLLRVWHEDRDDLRARGVDPGWPLSRVLAYISIACTIASNYLGFLTLSRLLNIEIGMLTNEQMRMALTPFTITALLVLDVAFVVLALYLRLVRAGLRR